MATRMEVATQATARAALAVDSLQKQLDHCIAAAKLGTDGSELPLRAGLVRRDYLSEEQWRATYRSAGLDPAQVKAIEVPVEAAADIIRKDLADWVTALEVDGLDPSIESAEMVRKSLSEKGTRR